MSSQYNRIGELEEQYSQQSHQPQPATGSSETSHLTSSPTFFQQLVNLIRKDVSTDTFNTDPMMRYSRSETYSLSTSSYFSDLFEMKKKVWYKNRLVLIVTGAVIIFIIIVMTLFIIEPWKK
jgi:hypothetical protein